MRIPCCIGLLSLVSLAFSGLPLHQPRPSEIQVASPEPLWVLLMVPLPAKQLVASEPTFDNSFPRFQMAKPVVTWTATNKTRPMVWTYKVLPSHFPATAISNLMAAGSFTMQDEKHGHKTLSDTNKETLWFFDKKRQCNLTVVPSQGWIEYWNGGAPARMSDRSTHRPAPAVGLPDATNIEILGLQFLNQFGIQRRDLVQQADGHLLTYGEKKTRSYMDKKIDKYIDDEVYARGIFFNRRLDGLSFASIGLDGGAVIEFGNHGKISDVKMVWRNLQRYEQRTVASPDAIMQAVLDGKAVLTHKNLVKPGDVKRLTITDFSLLYMGAPAKETQNVVYPFAQLEAVADMGTNSVDIQLYCPVMTKN